MTRMEMHEHVKLVHHEVVLRQPVVAIGERGLGQEALGLLVRVAGPQVRARGRVQDVRPPQPAIAGLGSLICCDASCSNCGAALWWLLLAIVGLS